MIATMRSIAQARAVGELRLDRDPVLAVAQRVAHLLERRHLHVAALGVLAHRLEPLAGRLLLEPVDDPGLGRDEEALLRRRASRSRSSSRSRGSASARCRTPSPGSRSRTPDGRAARRRAPRPASARCRPGRMPAWTWHSPSQIVSLRPVTFSSQRPRYMSGRKRISCSGGIASITDFAFPEVQQ